MARIKGIIVTKAVEDYKDKDGEMKKSFHIYLQAEDLKYAPANVVVSKNDYDTFQVGNEVELPGFIGSYSKFIADPLSTEDTRPAPDWSAEN